MIEAFISLYTLLLKTVVSFHIVDSLTDEESRKNWEEYGNPDGPGGWY